MAQHAFRALDHFIRAVRLDAFPFVKIRFRCFTQLIVLAVWNACWICIRCISAAHDKPAGQKSRLISAELRSTVALTPVVLTTYSHLSDIGPRSCLTIVIRARKRPFLLTTTANIPRTQVVCSAIVAISFMLPTDFSTILERVHFDMTCKYLSLAISSLATKHSQTEAAKPKSP